MDEVWDCPGVGTFPESRTTTPYTFGDRAVDLQLQLLLASEGGESYYDLNLINLL